MNDIFYFSMSDRIDPKNIVQNDMMWILDHIACGSRVLFERVELLNDDIFSVVIFKRCATDELVKKYLLLNDKYSDENIHDMLHYEDSNLEFFLNKYINVPSRFLEHCAKKEMLKEIEKQMLSHFKDVEITEQSMSELDDLLPEQIICVYKAYVNDNNK